MEQRQIPIIRTCCEADCLAVVAQTRFDERQITSRADGFQALGDPIRLKMVELLAKHDSLCVCEIQEAFDIGQPTVSHHLRALRDAGLVEVQRRGTWAYYSLQRETLKDLMKELVGAL